MRFVHIGASMLQDSINDGNCDAEFASQLDLNAAGKLIDAGEACPTIWISEKAAGFEIGETICEFKGRNLGPIGPYCSYCDLLQTACQRFA